jgi:tRNA threonylcarbamoyladenosine biosynthesis protein TsaB
VSTCSGTFRRSTPVILAIDTAASACSVAVGADIVLASETRPMRHGHGEALLPMIDAVMGRAGLSPTALDVVAVSTGPGGFTGIRVGLAAARGIAIAIGAELVGVTSFAAVAAAVAARLSARPMLIVLDSRRAELYVQLFFGSGEMLGNPAAVLPENLAELVAGIIGTAPLLLAGDAVETAALALARHADIELVAGSAPDALGVLAAARRRWLEGTAAVAARPLYIRAPDVTLPKARAAFRVTEKRTAGR